MMKIWLLGISIYPISYAISTIIKLFGGKNYPFELPASFSFIFIVNFLDSLLSRFGVNMEQLNVIIYASLIIITLICVNTICFALIISFLPKDWKPLAIIIVYIVFVLLNSYNLDINL